MTFADTPEHDDTTVLFVHGVGMHPDLFEPTASRLNCASETWLRPGYENQASVESFDEQVIRLIERLCQLDNCVVVGVSGGATLGLATAISQPDSMVGLITHEPLIGPLEPELNERIVNAADALRRDGPTNAATAFLSRLYGRPWPLHDTRQIADDVAQFASFTPTADELAAITIDHITTVGANSPPERHRVAHTLATLGADMRYIDQSGHLVLADNPDGFAQVINELIETIRSE